MAFGKYYSNTFVADENDFELMTAFRTACGDANAVLKKMTLIMAVDDTVSINGGAECNLYADVDALYKLSLDEKDMLVNSIVIGTSGTSVFLAGIY